MEKAACIGNIYSSGARGKSPEDERHSEGIRKILQGDAGLCYCPEEDLHIFCLLSEAALACFQPSRKLMGLLGKGLAGSHLLSPAKCVSFRLTAGFL